MTIVRHELRQGSLAWIIWTAAIGMFISICVSVFPEIREQTQEFNRLFASLGSFSSAFGMDRINLGTLIGFYTVECGSILGLGGGCYSALIGITALAREERDRTAEFLLTHPIRRQQIVLQKLLAVLVQVTLLNLLIVGVAISCISAIGEAVPWKELLLLHLALYFLQLEIAAICFGLSAFLHRGGAGVGLGVTILFYFMNLIANLSPSARALRFLTPYAYAEGANLLETGTLDWKLVTVGLLYGVLAVLLGYSWYIRKDIHN